MTLVVILQALVSLCDSSYSEMMFHFHVIALELIFAVNKKRILHICENLYEMWKKCKMTPPP